MKALTLYQPWATLIAIGAKKVETRWWSTKYRGPLAIHAGKLLNFINMRHPDCVLEGEIADRLNQYYNDRNRKGEPDYKIFRFQNYFPLGEIVATCELVDIVCQELKFPHGYTPIIHSNGKQWVLSPEELAFGCYEPFRMLWLLSNIKKLEVPIPAKGHQGLWEWDEK